MSTYRIIENIEKHISLTTEEKKYFLSKLSLKSLSRKEQLLQQGESCKSIFFVEAGILRAFHLNEEGKESTIMFAMQDWWITDMDAFVNKKYSLLTIEALEQSKVMKLDLPSLEKLYQELPKTERLFRTLFQNAYIREQRRSFHNISYSTEERYMKFIQQYPTLSEKVTQKQIASYLGVTPEFLSQIKKKSQS